MPPVKPGEEIRPATCNHDFVIKDKGILRYTIICRVCGLIQYASASVANKYPEISDGCKLPPEIRP